MQTDTEPACYVIVQIDVFDRKRYQEYQQVIRPIVAEYGIRLLVSSRSEVTVVEGAWDPDRVIVMRFDSKDTVNAMMQDERWKAAALLRNACARTNMIVVQGE